VSFPDKEVGLPTSFGEKVSIGMDTPLIIAYGSQHLMLITKTAHTKHLINPSFNPRPEKRGLQL
jgi:hypothetical protein